MYFLFFLVTEIVNRLFHCHRGEVPCIQTLTWCVHGNAVLGGFTHGCHVSLTGHCPKMSLWQEYVPCEGWLYHVWIPETLAHVYHSDAWNDQPYFVYRYAYV